MFFSILVFIFGLSLVVFSAMRQAAYAKMEAEVQGSFEQQPDIEVDVLEGEEEISEEEVDYYLAYPGILPDHPLYWLKMVRDRVRLWLTGDSEARFDRLLLYADKRVGAAVALIEGGKADLGVTTATKAEKYLEEAVSQFEKVKVEGKALPEKIEHLEKAIGKHEEVLRGVKERVPDQAKAALDKAIEKAVAQRERVRERFRERLNEGEGEGEGEEVQMESQVQYEEQQGQGVQDGDGGQGKGNEAPGNKNKDEKVQKKGGY
jgi:hypothetical protein